MGDFVPACIYVQRIVHHVFRIYRGILILPLQRWSSPTRRRRGRKRKQAAATRGSGSTFSQQAVRSRLGTPDFPTIPSWYLD